MLNSALFCMATAVYFEARNEPVEGQIAVAQVISTRAASPLFENSICDVVKEGGEVRNTCQFSFYCDGLPDRMTDTEARHTAIAVSVLVLSGVLPDTTDGATHYHADYVMPWWAQYMTTIKRISRHIFYREDRP